jgi:hypothetical protein
MMFIGNRLFRAPKLQVGKESQPLGTAGAWASGGIDALFLGFDSCRLALANAPLTRWKSVECFVKAKFIEPMLLLRSAKLPEGDHWTYEIKWDGYRAIAFKTGGTVHLHSQRQ